MLSFRSHTIAAADDSPVVSPVRAHGAAHDSRGARRATRLATAPLLLAASLLLAGCAGGAGAMPAVTEVPASSAELAEPRVTLSDGWAKAGDGMSAVFGSISNPYAHDLTLVGAETDVAGRTELHETVMSGATPEMREVEGGLTIPAGEILTLEPGGTHIMLMDLHDALLAGDEVTVTLTFDDDTEATATVLAKDYAGAEEHYEDGEPQSGAPKSQNEELSSGHSGDGSTEHDSEHGQ
ncbi:copper chaperone PCu(A)C [Leucobacter sp. USHLN153]|uniref:copper chaperone PCu(A)C n=1 Tax=Leucobacter sp. USHLN153 TaxID=3081268 RepID=UPI003018B2A8